MKLYCFHGNLRNLFPNNDVLSLYADIQYNYVEIDRFGFLNQFSKWNLGNKDDWFSLQSSISNSDEKFKEIFYDRINEIINKSNKENLNIYISWSGGVDSSAMVCGFLTSNIDKSKLKILYTEESINEHPFLYEILLKNNIEMIDLTNDLYAQIYISTINDGLLVTGWCADQLFGSIINQNYPDYFNKSYKDWIINYSKKVNVDFTNSIEQCESAFEYYKLPVKVFPQWAWFMNFAVKWEFVKITPFAVIGIDTDRIINFFDVEDFQKWSINNYDILSVKNQTKPNEYKLPLKKIIEEYTKDVDYTKYKCKKGSWINACSKHKKINVSLIDDEGFKCYNPNFNVNVNRLNTVTKRIIDKVLKNYEK